MEHKKIDRINELARKAKTPAGLTPEETAERAVLRKEYVQAVVGNLNSHLSNTYLVDDKGNKTKLKRKK